MWAALWNPESVREVGDGDYRQCRSEVFGVFNLVEGAGWPAEVNVTAVKEKGERRLHTRQRHGSLTGVKGQRMRTGPRNLHQGLGGSMDKSMGHFMPSKVGTLEGESTLSWAAGGRVAGAAA